MQQYFVNEILEENKTISLNEDIVFHLSKVLRNTETNFRLVDKNNTVFIAELVNGKANIIKKLDENNELSINITALISTIKQDKFEIILQKLTELGVNKIVPVKTAYSQDLFLNEKKILRFNKIIQEAAEQCHRNVIPELCGLIDLKDADKYISELNIVPYEKETNSNINLVSNSITFIIGPEGGFKKEEIDLLLSLGFETISLGKRILRAETAAINIASNIIWENK